MKEIDLTQILNDMKKGNKSSVQKSEILQDILDKMKKRNNELEDMD